MRRTSEGKNRAASEVHGAGATMTTNSNFVIDALAVIAFLLFLIWLSLSTIQNLLKKILETLNRPFVERADAELERKRALGLPDDFHY